MEYSRRALYALGEPLGECATRKVAGRIIYGGGGGQPKNTTQTTDLPAWAQPYAKDTLARGAALTDINQNPYQTYGGDRLAWFNPLQQTALEGARDMQAAPQLGAATEMATQAGQYTPSEFQNQFQYEGGEYTPGEFQNQYQSVGESWNPDAAQQYMNPFMEAALNPQLRSATRDAQMAQMQDQAAAVGRGAFGGSRTAIGQGMREQGLMQNLGDIRAKGYETAYTQAAQQFQQDQARKVQEASLRAQYGLSADQAREASRQFGSKQGVDLAALQAQYGLAADQAREQSRQFGTTSALNAAAQLGQLGGQQFQQGKDITNLQMEYGQKQQDMAQREKDIAYQQFLEQKNYPYKQLGFMSDLVRGMPLGQTSTTSIYGGSGDPLTTLGGLGAIGKGAGMFKKGGAVKRKTASGLGVLAMHKIAKG